IELVIIPPVLPAHHASSSDLADLAFSDWLPDAPWSFLIGLLFFLLLLVRQCQSIFSHLAKSVTDAT
ncbi:MAG TPA: hypothetical protein ACHBX0_00015, partial [Arsenophonus sp.]